MVTGDYHHTAIAVARGVGMLSPEGQLLIIQSKSELQSTAQGLDETFLASRSMHSSRYPPYLVLSSPRPRPPSTPGGRDPSLDSPRRSFAWDLHGSRDPSRDMTRRSFAWDPGSRDHSFTHTLTARRASFGGVSSGPKQATPRVALLAPETTWPEQGLSSPRPPPSCTPSTTSPLIPLSGPPPLSSPHRLASLTHQLQSCEQQLPQQRSSHHLLLTDQSSQWLSPQQRLLQQQSDSSSPLSHLQQRDEEESRLSQQESPQMQMTQEESVRTQRIQENARLPTSQDSAHMQTTHESAQIEATQESAQIRSTQETAQMGETQEVGSELCEGLVFMQQSVGHVEEVNAQQAITSLAQVPD